MDIGYCFVIISGQETKSSTVGFNNNWLSYLVFWNCDVFTVILLYGIFYCKLFQMNHKSISKSLNNSFENNLYESFPVELLSVEYSRTVAKIKQKVWSLTFVEESTVKLWHLTYFSHNKKSSKKTFHFNAWENSFADDHVADKRNLEI